MDKIATTQRFFDEEIRAVAIDVLSWCRERDILIGTGESLTGGLLAGLLTSIPGASDTYAGGIIAYQSTEKELLLDVSHELLREFGPVSEQCAEAMVRGVQKRCKVGLALATTGVAGPTSDERGTAVGTVYFGCALRDRARIFAYHFDPSVGRPGIRRATIIRGLRDSLAFINTSV